MDRHGLDRFGAFSKGKTISKQTQVLLNVLCTLPIKTVVQVQADGADTYTFFSHTTPRLWQKLWPRPHHTDDIIQLLEQHRALWPASKISFYLGKAWAIITWQDHGQTQAQGLALHPLPQPLALGHTPHFSLLKRHRSMLHQLETGVLAYSHHERCASQHAQLHVLRRQTQILDAFQKPWTHLPFVVDPDPSTHRFLLVEPSIIAHIETSFFYGQRQFPHLCWVF